ncbi:MAG: hypothetical protein ABI318_13365 [Chthoniobacteraceae bacterium]
MKFIRTNSVVGILVALITLLGWLALSNHCALGLMAKTAAAHEEHSCCHNGKPESTNAPGHASPSPECCKSLHAVTPAEAKLPATFAPVLAMLPSAWIIALDAQVPAESASAADNGSPPDVPNFTELVLHRSLRSHAPPLIA